MWLGAFIYKAPAPSGFHYPGSGEVATKMGLVKGAKATVLGTTLDLINVGFGAALVSPRCEDGTMYMYPMPDQLPGVMPEVYPHPDVPTPGGRPPQGPPHPSEGRRPKPPKPWLLK